MGAASTPGLAMEDPPLRRLSAALLGSVLTLALLAAPLAAEAQQSTTRPRIGYLDTASPSDAAARLSRDAFLQGLQALGRVDGQNVSIEYRWAAGHLDRLPDLASDLVRRADQVIE